MPIDPQQQFRERYDKYVASQQELRGKAGTPAPAPGSKISKKVIIFLGVLALAFGGGALYALNVNNSGPQVATDNPAKTVTTSQVTDAEIDAELQKIWGPYYNDAKNNPEYREAARQNILQQHAIENATKKYNISVSPQTVASTQSELFGNSNSIANVGSQDTAVTQDLLTQQAIEKKVVTWRTVDIASSFKSYGPTFNIDKQKAIDSLSKIRTLLLQGKTMQQAFTLSRNTQGFDRGLTIQENVYVTKTSGWSPKFVNAIFSASTGNVTPVITSDDAFMVARVTGENNTSYNSYAEWLSTQTK